MGEEPRFEMTIELTFSVPYFERNTLLTDQEIFDQVMAAVQEERDTLVVAAKVALIHLLDGEPIDG